MRPTKYRQARIKELMPEATERLKTHELAKIHVSYIHARVSVELTAYGRPTFWTVLLL